MQKHHSNSENINPKNFLNIILIDFPNLDNVMILVIQENMRAMKRMMVLAGCKCGI